ncbi:peptidoglycan DD-metalloendopeptidase family protein [Rathayibacter iranicus]|uniref:M23 family peptidase n=2 Tax=Rathayibacter iranicus TaxID=59737 RepID=A0AAD1EMS3_9MICO|nr:peptidoglycan DD-metalloendopeptidase family protein [Rathayibacter iranicus]AZZ55799.1 M23 family peptidase [Rathayibacter iranicus]MWV30775.1 peptidoglycan DD-metalloendopeptidase family protein [Rathayibacter iranicus NCPPB 2253 = VKM Ac-1602]PPI47567.1 hypothetical protein C5E09_06885 [Rathayibacter iranicus]PPI60412.1 hypothetical protein C5E08_07815 [Rathayibacter iranicus]PPI72195.1 hypothetical protein C5E01_06860 [Rathayibacter iranicus]
MRDDVRAQLGRRFVLGGAGALAVAGLVGLPRSAQAVATVQYRHPFKNPDLADGFAKAPAVNNSGRSHNGLDYAQPAGEAVPAVADGTVVISEWNRALGNVVVISHADGYFSGYCHLINPGLGVGTSVTRGQTIGNVGNTGNQSEGNHLHLTIATTASGYTGGTVVDPYPFINARLDAASTPDPVVVDTTRFTVSAVPHPAGVDVFWRGSDKDPQLYHRYQRESGWSASLPLGGGLASAPTVLLSESTIDVFYVSQTGTLRHNYFNGTDWTGDSPIAAGTSITGRISAVRRQNGDVNVFWRESNGSLGHAYAISGVWSAAGNLASGLTADPFAVVTTSGVVNVYYAGPDAQLLHVYSQPDGWSSSAALPADENVAGTPSAIAKNGKVNLFWRSTSGNLVQAYFDGNRWQKTGSALASGLTVDPVAVSTGSGDQIDVFYGNASRNLAHVWYSTEWSAPSDLPGTSSISTPAVSAIWRPNGRENVFWRGSDGRLTQSYFDPATGWGPSEPL